MRIPFNRIRVREKDKRSLLEALEKGWIAGGGPNTLRVEERLGEMLCGRRILATTSGTHALELAMRLSGIGPGDEVVLPSFTYPSTANCILARGAVPVFADVSEKGMNAGADEFEQKITARTRILLPVHYGGLSKDIQGLRQIADSRGLRLIEDAAQALGSGEAGRPLGTWGDFGCFSFHGTKNFRSGEGGALVVGEGWESLIEKAEAIRNGGTDKERFLRGEVDAYEWIEAGSMYLPSDLLMALLLPQLEDKDDVIEKRRRIFEAYESLLERYGGEDFIKEHSRWPLDGRAFNAHLFYIVFDTPDRRRDFQKRLLDCSIEASAHYRPLHGSSMGAALGWKTTDLPRTALKAQSLARLPLYENLEQEELDYILLHLKRILDSMGGR